MTQSESLASDTPAVSSRRTSPGWWLFVSGVLCVVVLSLRIVLPCWRRVTFIDEVTNRGGSVRTTPGGPEWIRKVVSDRALRGFDFVTKIQLQGAAIDDAWLLRLGEFPELESVDLFGTRLSDAGMRELQKLPSLRAIAVGYTHLTDAGLVHVAGMTQLEYFGVRGNDVTDAGLSHLARLTNLTGLHLGETLITDAGLVHLAGMNRLQNLWLYDTAVTETGIRLVAALPALRSLMISPDQITADGLDELQHRYSRLQITVMTAENDGSGYSERRIRIVVPPK